MAQTFEFPQYAAIMTPAGGEFILALDELHPIAQKKEIDTGGDPREKLSPETIFRDVIKCAVSDAVLFLTPYFRVASGSPSFPDGLATARFSLVIDNEIYILDGMVKNHLADIQGNLPDTAKLDFAKLKKGSFLGNMVSANGPIPRSTFGYFLVNDMPVSIEVRGVAAGYGKVELEAGFVSALYTTRAKK
jgi:hypothetical protein